MEPHAATSPSTQAAVWKLAAFVAALDGATKALAVRWWSHPTADAGPAHLHVVRNPGGPFGFAPRATVWFALLALIAVPLVAGAAARVDSRASVYGLGLVLGGTLGNVADRLLRGPGPLRGAVVDWIHIAPYRPVFNLADVALRVGGVLMIAARVWRKHPHDHDLAASRR